jgi:hypothetical protein
MSNTPGAQAQASTHAFRNSPSDIDELRDNVADIAGSVGIWRIASMSRLTTWQLMLSKKLGNLKRLMSVLEPIPCQEGQILLDADSSLDDVFSR